MKQLNQIQSSEYLKKHPKFPSVSHSTGYLPLVPLPELTRSPNSTKSNLMRLQALTPTSKVTKFSMPQKHKATSSGLLNRLPPTVSKNLMKPSKVIIERRHKYDSRNSGVNAEWRLIPCNGLTPEARDDGRMVIIENSLYLFGGQGRIKPSSIHALNLTSFSWSIQESVKDPLGRYGHSLVSFKDNLIVFGGITTKWNDLTSDIDIYNLSRGIWDNFAARGRVPDPRKHHAAVQIGKEMLIFGGTLRSGKKSNELILIDLIESQWIHICLLYTSDAADE